MPVFRPMPRPIVGRPRDAQFGVERHEAVDHLERGAHGVLGVRGVVTGAPQKAMMASPMYLSSVPRWPRMAWVMVEKKRLTRARSSCGGSDSETRVKLRMSQNITVSTRLLASMV